MRAPLVGSTRGSTPCATDSFLSCRRPRDHKTKPFLRIFQSIALASWCPAVNWIYPLSKFDGEGVPNYLEAERHAGRWNGEAPAPPLPHELVLATGERYLEAFRRLTGWELTVGAC